MNNDLWNTDWQILTAQQVNTKYNYQGTGTLPALSVTSHTTGNNYVTFYTSNTSQLKNGDLVELTGGTYISNLCSVKAENVVTNTSFGANLPRGLVPSNTSALTARVIQRSDISGVTTHAADNWNKTQSLYFWVDDNSQNLDIGTKRVAAVKKGSSSAEFLTYNIPETIAIGYAGQDYTFKVRVKSAGTWRAYIYNGSTQTYSASQSGSGFIEAQVTANIDTSNPAITVGIEFTGSSGTVSYVSKPIAYATSSIPTGYYRKREGQFRPIVKYTPETLHGASITLPSTSDGYGTYGWLFRVNQETNGVVANDVLGVNFCWEFDCASSDVALAWRNRLAPPHIYGNIAHSVGGQSISTQGDVWFYNGEAFLYSAHSGASFTNVSADYSSFYL